MKTLKAGLVVFGLMAGSVAMAQEKEGRSPQERAQFRTDRMAKELSLTEDQKTKVSAMNLEMVEKNQAIKNDASLTAEQKKEAFKANRKAQKAKLKEVLTKEQLAILKAKKSEIHAEHKKGKYAGKEGKTVQERAQSRTDWMAKELSLTEEQKTKVAAINLAATEKNAAIKNDAALSQEQKKEAFKANHEETKAKLKDVLTEEQLATLKAKKDKVREEHPAKHGRKK